MKLAKSKIRVAWQHPIIPSYRVPYLEKLEESQEIDVTSFHGQGKDGYTTRSVGEISSINSVQVKNYYWMFGHGRIFWQAAVKKILKGKFDVIVCEEVVHNCSVWILWLIMKIKKKPIILHGFGYRPTSGMSYHRKTKPSIQQVFIDKLRFFMLRRASAIAVYTEKGKQACVQEGIQPEKVFVMKNTYDTKYLMSLEKTVSSEELSQIVTDLNLTGRFVLIFLGRLNPLKKASLLIDVMWALKSSPLDASLLIIGEGIDLQSLKEQANGLSDVHFLGGIHDEKELAKLFMVSDLLVIPGLPGLTCVHGFCYGVPIVTTAPIDPRWPECPELDYIQHEENGYFIPTPDVELFKDAILKMAQNKKQLTKMGDHARETARSLPLQNTVDQFCEAVKFSVNGMEAKSLD